MSQGSPRRFVHALQQYAARRTDAITEASNTATASLSVVVSERSSRNIASGCRIKRRDWGGLPRYGEQPTPPAAANVRFSFRRNSVRLHWEADDRQAEASQQRRSHPAGNATRHASTAHQPASQPACLRPGCLRLLRGDGREELPVAMRKQRYSQVVGADASQT